jgi:hypothetical protein
MAVNSGRLYVGLGSGPNTGPLRSFALTDLETALNTSTPLDWTSGTIFNDINNNSGFGLVFDKRGYLYAGGVPGLTVFDPLGNAVIYENNGFTGVEYDPVNDLLLITGCGTYQGLYPAAMFVPEPATFVLAFGGLLALVVCGRRRLRRAA